MSFYKGNKFVKTWESQVVNSYIEGIRLYKDKYNSVKREPLPTGTTKYNMLILERVKNIITDYGCLMSMECIFIRIMEKYSPKDYGLVMNIKRILTAQKGTIEYMRLLSSMLKKYSVKHQGVYDCIKTELSRTEERCDRNAKFLDIFAEDCGLKEAVDVIHKEHNKNLFEFIKSASSEFYENHNMLEFESKDAYIEARDNYCYEAFVNAISKSGIDIESSIKQASAEKAENLKMMSEKVKKEKYERRQQKKINASDAAIEQHKRDIYDSLYKGNVGEIIPKVVYNSMIHNLLKMGGKGCYVTILRMTKLQFMSEAIDICSSLMNAKWFPNETCDEIKNDIKVLRSKYPDAIITVQPVFIPLESESLKSNNTVEDSIKTYETYVKNLIAIGDCSNVTMLKFERCLRRNNNVIYFVAAAAKECGYYICNMICENDPSNIKNHNSPKYYMSSRIQSPALFNTEQEALECIERIKDWENLAKYSLHVCKIETEMEYKFHDRSDEIITRYMNSFVRYINNLYFNESAIYPSQHEEYFNGKDSKKAFISTLECHKHIQLPIRVDILDNNIVNFIHIRNKNNTTSTSEVHDLFGGKFPNGVITCYPSLMYPVYAVSSNKNDIIYMSELTKILHDKFDKRNIIRIVELTADKDGKYSWKLIDAN